MATRLDRSRAAWLANRPALRETPRAPTSDPPVQVIGTKCDESGGLCGPYEARYTVEHGYCIERTVIVPR